MSNVSGAEPRGETVYAGHGMRARVELSGLVLALQQEPIAVQDHRDATGKGRFDFPGDFAVLIPIPANRHRDREIDVSAIRESGHSERTAGSG